MCIRDRCKESIEVEGSKRVNFSLNGVVGGEIHVLRKDESAFNVYSVSYTHLDVYKRQGIRGTV